MKELTNVIERKEFVQNEELKKKYENDHHVHNILTREDFVNDEDLKNKYNDTIIPVLENSQEVKLLEKCEKVLGFEEYINSKKDKAV